ncbi:hypothetical protein, partial, partial [Parasitella parasitica]
MLRLAYLQFDQLNICQDVIRILCGLAHWRSRISSKDDFVAKCMPQLIP